MTSRRRFLQAAVAALGASVVGCRAQRAPEGRSVASLWFTYGGRNRVVLEELVGKFNQQQSAHWIEAVFQGDYFEGLAKLRTGIAAGAGPTFSHVIGEVVPYLDEAGVLEPLDGYPEARDLDIIPELGQDKSWVGGADRPLVALPFNRSTPIAYCNADVFETVGVSPPYSWDQLRATARRLTERQGGRTLRYGFGCPISWWFWVALVGQAGGKIVEDDGRVTLGAAHGTEAVELWQKLVREDRSMKPPPGRDYNAWEATNQDFLAGRTAMIWTSTAFLKYLEDNAPFRVLAAPLPGKRRRAVPTGGTHWVMLAGAEARAKTTAWEFLRWVHGTEQVRHWATNTGYMPVTRQAVRALEAEGYYDQHPNDRVAVDQLAVAMPWPWSPELFRLQREIVQPRLERAILTNADAGHLLDEARALARGGAP